MRCAPCPMYLQADKGFLSCRQSPLTQRDLEMLNRLLISKLSCFHSIPLLVARLTCMKCAIEIQAGPSPLGASASVSNVRDVGTSMGITDWSLQFLLCLYVEDIKFVINFDYPNCSEDYVHRIGRTARSTNTGTAYTLFTPGNIKQAPDLISVLREAKQVVSPKLLQLADSSRNYQGKSRSRWGNKDRSMGFSDGRDRDRSSSNRGGGGSSFGSRRSFGGSGGGDRTDTHDKPKSLHQQRSQPLKPNIFSQQTPRHSYFSTSSLQNQSAPEPLMNSSPGNVQNSGNQHTSRGNFQPAQQGGFNQKLPQGGMNVTGFNNQAVFQGQLQQSWRQNQNMPLQQFRPPLPMSNPPPPPPQNQGF